MENIAIHSASTYGGAQFYISCGQVEVTGGGSGTPGPLVAIPGVYTGYASISIHLCANNVFNVLFSGARDFAQHLLSRSEDLDSTRSGKW